jgi:hypothetical protein
MNKTNATGMEDTLKNDCFGALCLRNALRVDFLPVHTARPRPDEGNLA